MDGTCPELSAMLHGPQRIFRFFLRAASWGLGRGTGRCGQWEAPIQQGELQHAYNTVRTILRCTLCNMYVCTGLPVNRPFLHLNSANAC